MMDYFEQAKSFLSRYYPHALEEPPYTGDDISHDPTRPFVTLTYAQSLDGKIGGQNGQQIRLSGQASMAMTHRMRTLHDAILVGIGTVWHDDPRLAARHLPPNELPPQSSTPVRQPQPVILDTRLRMPLTSRLLDPARHASGDCLPPWIMVGEGLVDPIRQQQVEARGARVFPVAVQANGRLDFMAVLQKLKALGIRRVMVEGGSQVIRQLLLSSTEQSSLVDLLIVTIAPVFVGEQGVSALGEQSMTSQHVCYPNLNVLEYATFTPDIVMVATMKSSQSSSHIHHQ